MLDRRNPQRIFKISTQRFTVRVTYMVIEDQIKRVTKSSQNFGQLNVASYSILIHETQNNSKYYMNQSSQRRKQPTVWTQNSLYHSCAVVPYNNNDAAIKRTRALFVCNSVLKNGEKKTKKPAPTSSKKMRYY